MAEQARGRRAREGWPLLLAAAALLAAGLVLMPTTSVGHGEPDPREQSQAATPTPSAPTEGAARAASASASVPGIAQHSRAGMRPDSVIVPAQGVRAVVSPITTEAGALDPPSDPRQVGWWSGGERPGSPRGAAVLTGHTVHSGGGAFDDLEELAPGDEVVVRAGRTRLSYAVESVRVLSRAELARQNARVFGHSGPGRLVLITCEDWDGTAYRSNVVVTAVPVSG